MTLLLCPVCQSRLKKTDREAVCENNHHFDYAKEGYINLLLKQSVDHGDNKEMVKARTDFLNTDAYLFLKDRLCEMINEEHPQTLADLGCGEGYYTKDFPAEEKYGFDVSKAALKHAAKKDKDTQYAVASIFHLPLPDSSVDTAVTCFAPAALQEIHRILKDNGSFLFVTPGKDHLMELKELLYDVPYENVTEDLNTDLTLEKTETIRNTFTVTDNETLMNLFSMTPYAHRTPKEGIEKLKETNSLTITAEFIIRLYRKSAI